MAHPQISVLMSVFNGEKYLHKAIDSVLNQTFRDFEFIIVDDASTDNSKKIIKSYQDDRIIFIENENNLGLTKSLNKALSFAKGDYIARIDHDDIYFENKLEKQIEFIRNNADCSILFADVKKIDDEGNEIKSYSRIKTAEDIYYLMHFINPVIHPTVMIKSELMKSIAGYNDEFIFAQDYELWSRLIYDYKFYKLNEALVYYRVSSEQISHNNLEQQKGFAEKVFVKMMERIGISEINDEILYFHRYAFQDNVSKITFNHLKTLKFINSKIIDLAPKFLNKRAVKHIARKNYIYYYLVFLKKWKIIEPLINILKKIS